MKPNEQFKKLDKSFWANVRSISQKCGYTIHSNKKKNISSLIKIPDIEEVKASLTSLGLSSNHLIKDDNTPTQFGELIFEYFKYRADILNNSVESLLMDVEESKKLYKNFLRNIPPLLHNL